jgi:hypothetical protein
MWLTFAFDIRKSIGEVSSQGFWPFVPCCGIAKIYSRLIATKLRVALTFNDDAQTLVGDLFLHFLAGQRNERVIGSHVDDLTRENVEMQSVWIDWSYLFVKTTGRPEQPKDPGTV